ncbi:NAD(P)-dependent oxidoreductase [Nitrosopumilus sp.]|nr:NAD(P)-dependent oxidoreductase [Nitrosopumilus sp.]|tara:strand:- start:496 stop:1344 length:849 start_codon:yes stop_codon:yes gene_type:complete
MKNSILITGTTGFIGKHLVKKIPNYNMAVDQNGKKIDLRIREEVLKIKRVDIVIHLAGKIPSEKNYSKNIFFEHNVLGTLNVLEYCIKKKVKKIIFVSSYVYGNPEKNPINEKNKIKPHNTYTKSKVLSEELCKIYAEKYKIEIIILRPFNIFGNLQKDNSLISNTIKSIKNNSHITIINKNDKRDYLFIDDLINAIVKLIDYKCKFEIFNVGSGKSYSFENVVQLFEKKNKKKIKRKYKTFKKNSIPKIQADISKIKKEIKWIPRYTLEEGIEKIVSKNTK